MLGGQDRQAEATTWDSLGYAHYHLGDHQQAATCYQHALNLYRDLAIHFYQAGTLVSLGDTHLAAGDPSAARTAWCEALTILDESDLPDAEQVRAKIEQLDQAGLRGR